MKTKSTIFVIAVLLLAVTVFFMMRNTVSAPSGNGVGSSTVSTTTNTTSNTSVADKTVSDGTILIAYSDKDFALATNASQILVHPYIPPCGEGFDYCFYYNGDAYQGTNFESAGVRIQKRKDITTEKACMSTPPTGYDTSVKPNKQIAKADYSSAVFQGVGDAGAGHFVTGDLYRLYVKKSMVCYEFETRIGQTQFANYPEGAILEFTKDDQDKATAMLQTFVNQISLLPSTSRLF